MLNLPEIAKAEVAVAVKEVVVVMVAIVVEVPVKEVQDICRAPAGSTRTLRP